MKFFIFFLVIFALGFFYVSGSTEERDIYEELGLLFPHSSHNSLQPKLCRDTIYGKIGDDCSTEPNSPFQCKMLLTCVNGKCQSGTIGSKCLSHSDCAFSGSSSESVRCINGVCFKKRYNGSPCSLDDQCYSQMCQGGMCFGYGEAENCDPTAPVSCARGLYCSWNRAICVKQRSVGDRCDDYDNRLPINEIPEGSNYMVSM